MDDSTHPDAVLWPDEGITKGDLVAYYRALGPIMLPYLADRPLTLVACPAGIGARCHYRRSLAGDPPDGVRTVSWEPESTGKAITLPLVDSVPGLLSLVNTAAIEFHVWGARTPRLTEPDLLIFDLDPGNGIAFDAVLETALLLKRELERRGLRGWAKTTGGAGLHVFVPVVPRESFEQARGWVKALADRLAAAHPDLIAAVGGATHAAPRVTVDYAQNGKGKNTAAPYTVRARPGAPVSTPITWDEVARGEIRPADFTPRTVPERVRELGDPFAPVVSSRQRLPPID